MHKDHVKDNVQQQLYEYNEKDLLVFEVEITFYNKDEKAIKEFIHNKLAEDRKIRSICNNYVKLSWPHLDWESPGDIENALYYILWDGELGKYSYY